MYIGAPEHAVELRVGKQSFRNLTIRELAPVEHPARLEPTPNFTLEGIISGASAHVEEMQARGMPVSRRHAIDQVLRMPGRAPQDRLGRLQPAPVFDVDEATAHERRINRVPSFVDPELLFKNVVNETAIPQSADYGPSIDNFELARDRRIAHGASPVAANYQGAIEITLAEWEMRDRIQAEAAAREAAHEAEVAKTRSVAAWRENVTERRLDRPKKFGEQVRRLT